MDWYGGDGIKKLDTHFASPERSPIFELQSELEIISKSKILEAMLKITGSLLAILNKNRQVLMLNDNFLNFLGINNADEAFGLRLGEFVNCVHSKDMEAGCGTSEYCKTCGAVISIITAIESNEPSVEKCIIDTDKATLVLQVKTVPLIIEGVKVLLLFADDISEVEYCRAAGNYFYNDMKRMLEAMYTNIDMLKIQLPASSFPMISNLETLSTLISKSYRDIDFYKAMITENIYDLRPMLKRVNIAALLDEIRGCFNRRYSNSNKELIIDWNFRNIDFLTDDILFLKVIYLLLDNAFEHTKKVVKIWLEFSEKYFLINIWNDENISDDVSKRIFQKFYSTKDEKGHGFGTFMAKFIAEKVLKGRLSFKTGDGTVFTFEHPIR
jgi:light-regulated signal transduction histidine kinase (bacteriophytochrome)